MELLPALGLTCAVRVVVEPRARAHGFLEGYEGTRAAARDIPPHTVDQEDTSPACNGTWVPGKRRTKNVEIKQPPHIGG